MSKLLRAGFFHRRKSILFWATLLFSLAYGIIYAAICLMSNSIEDGVFLLAMFLVMSIYVSLSTGSERSNGVIRNKVITGHTKWAIFMSEIIMNIVICALMMLLFLVPFVIVGCYRLFTNIPVDTLLYVLLGLILVSVLYAAVFTLISYLVKSKAVGSITCIFLTAAIMVGAYYCELALGQVEYMTITISDSSTEEITEEIIENPNYVGGMARDVLKAANCVLPQGQTDGYLLYLYILNKNVDTSSEGVITHFEDYTNISVYPFCSVLLTIFIVGVGWITVRKRDLK